MRSAEELKSIGQRYRKANRHLRSPGRVLNKLEIRIVRARTMKKVGLAFLFFLLGSVCLLRADQSIADVQQALKDQGFYYGDVTGTKTADTTAAIRRYQIRNGLQVTGEVD